MEEIGLQDVVTIGESMVLFAPMERGPLRYVNTYRRHVAGAESNLAVGLSKLKHSVGWISSVGDDEFGAYLLNTIRGEGVDVSRVKIDPFAPTGIYFKELSATGRTRVFYYRSGSAASKLGPGDLDLEYICSSKLLHITGITPALSESCRMAVDQAVTAAREAGVMVSFDPNLRLKLWSLNQARRALNRYMELSDIVLTGVEEAKLLIGEEDPDRIVDALLEKGPSTVVVKLGEAGALGATAQERSKVPSYKITQVVDPVGAGDAFDAGFLAGTLRGWPLERKIKFGNAMGAFAVTVEGDMEGLASEADLASFMDWDGEVQR